MNQQQVVPATPGRLGRGAFLAIVGVWLLADLLLRGASAAAFAAGTVAATTRATAPARTQGPRKWASSLPSAAPKRHVATTLNYEQLGGQIGERVLITTVHGDLRDVRIEAYSRQEILVRVSVVGGYATQHIQRSQIRSIRDTR